MIKRFVTALALAAIAAVWSNAGHANDYPTRAIRLVVPYPPGGATDLVARLVATQLAKQFGKPVVIENKPGAAATVGSEFVARSAPDGYTLLVATPALLIEPALGRQLAYDVRRDFLPISTTATGSFLFTVNAQLPPKSIAEFISYAKANPGKLNFGSPGIGATNHLAAELFRQAAGLDMVHVPYRGEALALNGLLGGEIQMFLPTYISAGPHIASGLLRVLAVTSDQRTPVLPEVPTVAESGLPGYEGGFWHGIVAPAGTPAAIVERWHTEIVAATRDPELKGKVEAQGLELVSSTPADFAARIERELSVYAKAARTAGLSAQ